MSQVTERQLEDIEALFVQTAASLTSDGEKTITLHGLSPSTLYFADRPKREVGHMSSARFVDLWGEGENSFAVDPPNAVLSFAEPEDRTPEDVVVTIREALPSCLPSKEDVAMTRSSAVFLFSTSPCTRESMSSHTSSTCFIRLNCPVLKVPTSRK